MELEPFLRMLTAAVLAVPVGLDRELRGKAAGLRTHVVMGTAAAALGYVSVLAAPFSGTGQDGTRIAAQVVTGVGFMGAGVIFASAGRVHGLTSAAALFSVAASGLCVGLGETPLAFALVTVTVLFLWPVDRITGPLIGAISREERIVHLLATDLDTLKRAQQLLAELDARARDIELDTFGDAIAVRLTIRARRRQGQETLAALARVDGVMFVSDEAFVPAD
jgi:putative Mg2+ transporter-C (MgtC) family protein